MVQPEPTRRRVLVLSRCAWTLFKFRAPLLTAIRKRGWDAVAMGDERDGYAGALHALEIGFQPLRVSFSGVAPLSDIRMLFALYWRIRRLKPDVVHAFTIKPAIYGTLAASLAGVPTVVTITGLGYAFTSARRALRLLVEMLYRFSLGRAAFVFFQNPVDRDLFVAKGLVSPEKTAVVEGSGVDLEAFSYSPPPCTQTESVSFMMVSRLLRDKGVAEYCHAAELVRAQYPRARISLLGGIDPRNPSSFSRDQIEAMVRKVGIEWNPHVDDVRPYVRGTDVVVLPSYREGLPRSLLEAAAMGRAVIATNVPGCREAVEEPATGLLVPARDSQALADAMLRLAADPAAVVRMGQAGREMAERRFDQRIVIEAALRSYDRLFA